MLRSLGVSIVHDLHCGIFSVRIVIFLHEGPRFIVSYPKDFCKVCTEFDSGEISGRVQI